MSDAGAVASCVLTFGPSAAASSRCVASAKFVCATFPPRNAPTRGAGGAGGDTSVVEPVCSLRPLGLLGEVFESRNLDRVLGGKVADGLLKF